MNSEKFIKERLIIYKEDWMRVMEMYAEEQSIEFAEWLDIYGSRTSRNEWTYKNENHTKKRTTQWMYNEWQNIKELLS